MQSSSKDASGADTSCVTEYVTPQSIDRKNGSRTRDGLIKMLKELVNK